MKEIRVDEINNDIVIFAKDRARRPMDKVINENEESIIGEYFVKEMNIILQNQSLR